MSDETKPELPEILYVVLDRDGAIVRTNTKWLTAADDREAADWLAANRVLEEPGTVAEYVPAAHRERADRLAEALRAAEAALVAAGADSPDPARRFEARPGPGLALRIIRDAITSALAGGGEGEGDGQHDAE